MTVNSLTEACAEIAYDVYSTAEVALEGREDRLRELREHLATAAESIPNTVTKGSVCEETDNKVAKIRARIKPMKATASAEVGTTVSWGGSDGTQVSSYANGSVQSDTGAYAGAKFEQDWGGEGQASIVAGAKKDFEDTDTSKNSRERTNK